MPQPNLPAWPVRDLAEPADLRVGIRPGVPPVVEVYGDLVVRRTARREARDPGLLRGEVEDGRRRTGPRALASRAQLCRRLLGEPVRAHRGEHVLRGAQLLACVPPPLGPPQPLAVEQMRAREVHCDPALGQLAEEFQVRAFGVLALFK